jgi:hypothetical protein
MHTSSRTTALTDEFELEEQIREDAPEINVYRHAKMW